MGTVQNFEVGISVQSLHEQFGDNLFLGSIFAELGGPDNGGFYDLFNEYDELACLDGEQVSLYEIGACSVTFCNNNGDCSVYFSLSPAECQVALLQEDYAKLCSLEAFQRLIGQIEDVGELVEGAVAQKRGPVYRNIEACADGEYLKDNLPTAGLQLVEHVLEAYGRQIDLVVPRNDNGEVDFDGEWAVEVMNDSYAKVKPYFTDLEFELTVLKWVDGFEDTGYLADVVASYVHDMNGKGCFFAARETDENIEL